MLYRLRDGSQNAGKALIWLEGELEKPGSDAEEIIVGEHRNLSSGNVTMGNIVRGLRLVNDVDWTVWFETVSRIDELLREKTDFAQLDFHSRDQYRTAIEVGAPFSKVGIRGHGEGHRPFPESSRSEGCRSAYGCGLLPHRQAA
jgi:cyclic beta-1,2-glucan synthetase